MTHLKLGKLPAREDRRDLLFSDFRTTGALKTAPVGFGTARIKKVKPWGMLGNGPDDSVRKGFRGAGCCVLSDAGHQTIYFNSLAGKTVLITGKQTISDYTAVTGYVLGDDSTDQGTDMRTALNWRRKVGTLDAQGKRHKIYGYAALEPTNWTELLQALAIFDAVSIGIQFPSSAMTQFNQKKPWTYVKGAEIEGGHDVPVLARAAVSTDLSVSWNRVQPFTRGFLDHYNDESYGIISQESVTAGRTPDGVLWADLLAAIKEFPSV